MKCGAGTENRTRAVSLEGWGSTIKLYPRILLLIDMGKHAAQPKWCPEGDSNSHTRKYHHLKVARLPIPPSGPLVLTKILS